MILGTNWLFGLFLWRWVRYTGRAHCHCKFCSVLLYIS